MDELTTWYALQHIYDRYADTLAAYKGVLEPPDEHMDIDKTGLDKPFRMGFAITALQEISCLAKFDPAIPEYAEYRDFGDELANCLLHGMEQENICDADLCKTIAENFFAAFVVLYLHTEATTQAQDFPTTAAGLLGEAKKLPFFSEKIERLDRAYHVYRVLMVDAAVEKPTEPMTVIPIPNADDLKARLQQPLFALFTTIKINRTPK